MSRVRILLLTPGLGLGGSERLTLTYARGLNARGHETLIVHGPPEGLAATTRSAGVEHLLVYPERLGVRTLRPWLRALRATVREFQPDVMHAQSVRTALVAAMAAPRTPLLATVHGMEVSQERGAAILLRLSRARVTAVSQDTADGVRRYRIAPPMVIVPPAVDLDLLERSARGVPATAILERRPLVTCVARHDPVKGVDVLIDAFPRVLEKIPEAGLQLVGGGSVHHEIVARVEELGIGYAIDFTNFQSNPAPYLVAADLAVLPSRREGLPVSALEAFALGRAVVATAVGGTPDVVRDGETGWLVPPEEPEALAAAIVDALSHPEERERRAALGHALVARSYTVDGMIDRIEEICRSAAGSEPPARRNNADIRSAA